MSLRRDLVDGMVTLAGVMQDVRQLWGDERRLLLDLVDRVHGELPMSTDDVGGAEVQVWSRRGRVLGYAHALAAPRRQAGMLMPKPTSKQLVRHGRWLVNLARAVEARGGTLPAEGVEILETFERDLAAAGAIVALKGEVI